jgi:mono/diheme cytochrome c family protein
MKSVVLVALIALVGAFAFLLFRLPFVGSYQFSEDTAALQRGGYLVTAGGCVSCHINPDQGNSLSGGMALESDFGVFRVPNITPDISTGIGNWSAEDFVRAIRHGRNTDGGFYFPAFPYRAYSGLSDQDVLDMGSYLMSLEPVANDTGEHDLPLWIGNWMMAGWNLLADLEAEKPVAITDPVVARGAYLARYLGHCGECHTPRNSLGILSADQEFGGATIGESHADPINLDALHNWSVDDFAFFLFLGMKPDEEYVGGAMESVIAHNTSRLTEDDRLAMARFFKFEGPR